MARRRVVEDNVSHERWLVSYADFITLLFAFFVVMYSISQVNEGKYKVLSDTLTEAFNISQEEALNAPELTLDPFQVGELAKSNPLNLIALRNNAVVEQQEPIDKPQTGKPEVDNKGEQEAGEDTGQLPDDFQQISDSLGQELGHLINQDLITIRGDEQWLEIELKSAMLFDSGDATLSVPALEILASIVETLLNRTNLIRVEGFTDNVPVNTVQFPSNWELSAARAAAVVQLFVEEGIDPKRMAAIGYGEHQPIDDNATEQGRAANRRVVLRIAKEGELRPVLTEVSLAAPAVDGATATQTTDTAQPPQQQPPGPEDPLNGVRTIELEGGGLLFTNDPETNNPETE